MKIESAEMVFLSLDRAMDKAPKEFLPAYEWFLDHEGAEPMPRPLARTGLADGIPVSLVAGQRGIHKPAGHRYALSIVSSGNKFYSDGAIDQGDGTWILNYSAQRKNVGSAGTTDMYNEALRKCMREGLPVGVLVNSPGSSGLYECKGLAFVESYEDGVFILHGPVRRDQDSGFWSVAMGDDISAEVAELISSLDVKDERTFRAVLRAQRVGQSRFRDDLLKAYDRKCAISDCDVEPALQAAHISSYLGPKSQLTSNGLLLRADLHLLYDSSLMSVDPDGYRVKIASSLKGSHYRDIDGLKIRLPYYASDRPSEARLQSHFERFMMKQAL